MGCVYFVRHGQTVWNVENKICGATDIELTQLGHEQAVLTGQEILKQGIKADEILYSPLIRAKDTALHISQATGIPAREEIRLKEQNFGKYESTPRNGAEFQLAEDAYLSREFTQTDAERAFAYLGLHLARDRAEQSRPADRHNAHLALARKHSCTP